MFDDNIDEEFSNERNETKEENMSTGNKYYEEALNHVYALQHVLNNGKSITGRRFYGYNTIDEFARYVNNAINEFEDQCEIHEILANVGDRPQLLNC